MMQQLQMASVAAETRAAGEPSRMTAHLLASLGVVRGAGSVVDVEMRLDRFEVLCRPGTEESEHESTVITRTGQSNL